MSWDRLFLVIVVPLVGLFSLWCSIKNYDWFMEHRKAKALSNIIGRGGARIFYAVLGAGLIVSGLVMAVVDIQ